MRTLPLPVLLLLLLPAGLANTADARAASCSTTLSPGASIGAAIGAAHAGQTICLTAGSYERIETSADKQNVTVQPAQGASATVAGALITGASGITLRRLDITPEGVIVRGSRDIMLEDSHIHDIRRDPSCPSAPNEGSGYGFSVGILSQTRSHHIVVRGNLIDRIPLDGIYIGSTDDLLIEQNEITHVYPERCGDHSDSIQWVAARGVTIRRNWFHDSTHGLQVHGPNNTFRENGRIENNLMTGITSIGFNLYSVDGLAIVNNTVWDTGNVAVRISSEADDPTQMHATIRNNLFEEYSNTCGDCVETEQRNIVGGNPRFASSYELRPSSPAVDAGTTLDAPAVDRLGRRRDSLPDVGAQEVVKPGSEPSPRHRHRAGGLVAVRGHRLIARGAQGVSNRLTAQRRGRIWRVTDVRRLRAGHGCRSAGLRVVRCHTAGVRSVVLVGGVGNDRLKVVGRVRALLLGGPGDDRLIGGSRALFKGGRGDDLVRRLRR